MGLDMNLHRALDKLVDSPDVRTEAEERDLGELIQGCPWVIGASCRCLGHFAQSTQGHPCTPSGKTSGLTEFSGFGEDLAELLHA